MPGSVQSGKIEILKSEVLVIGQATQEMALSILKAERCGRAGCAVWIVGQVRLNAVPFHHFAQEFPQGISAYLPREMNARAQSGGGAGTIGATTPDGFRDIRYGSLAVAQQARRRRDAVQLDVTVDVPDDAK
jgi:hypothetical protein